MIVETKKTQPSDGRKLAGLIYAGGRGERMGGVDKALYPLQGEPMITHSTRALSPFVDHLYIARQRDQAALADYGEVIFDDVPDQGPLAGLVAAIKRARTDGFHALLTVAVDAGSLPDAYRWRLESAARPHAMAMSSTGLHPTFAWIDLRHSDDIINCFQSGQRALRAWMSAETCAFAEFRDDELRNRNKIAEFS